MSGYLGRPMAFPDLLWDDILVTHIFPKLDFSDLVNMMLASPEFVPCVEHYLMMLKEISWNTLDSRVIEAICGKTGNLRKIVLISADHVSGNHMRTLLQNNMMLNSVSITSCSHFSIENVSPMMQLKNLTVIYIDNNEWADDTFFKSFSEDGCCGHLTAVSISNCPATDIGLVPFFKKCTKLEIVFLEYLPSITMDTINVIYSCCENLMILKSSNNFIRNEPLNG